MLIIIRCLGGLGEELVVFIRVVRCAHWGAALCSLGCSPVLIRVSRLHEILGCLGGLEILCDEASEYGSYLQPCAH